MSHSIDSLGMHEPYLPSHAASTNRYSITSSIAVPPLSSTLLKMPPTRDRISSEYDEDNSVSNTPARKLRQDDLGRSHELGRVAHAEDGGTTIADFRALDTAAHVVLGTSTAANAEGMQIRDVEDFSVDDILAETAGLVQIPGSLDEAPTAHFGGVDSLEASIAHRISSGHHKNNLLVADADSMTALRVENVTLKARISALEKQLAEVKQCSASATTSQSQYQKLSNVLRVRNSELENQVAELSAKYLEKSHSVGKLNDLILRQDAALKHVRKAAGRKIKLAKRKVSSTIGVLDSDRNLTKNYCRVLGSTDPGAVPTVP